MPSIITLMSQSQSGYRKYITFSILLVFIIFWSVILYLYDPQELVMSIGISNSYIIVFLLALIGAFSSFTTVSIYPALITFAAGNLNPFLLGLLAGIGLTIGDIFFFYFGSKARNLVGSKFKEKLDGFLKWLEEKPKWLIPLSVYIYVAFTPFPNNVFTGSLALSGYSLKKIFLPVLLGDLTLCFLVAFLAGKGVELL